MLQGARASFQEECLIYPDNPAILPSDFSTNEMPRPETLPLLCIGENVEVKARLHTFSSMDPLECVQFTDELV